MTRAARAIPTWVTGVAEGRPRLGVVGPTSRRDPGGCSTRWAASRGREPEFILTGAGPGLRRGTEDYIQTAVLIPALFHIPEALTEALVKQTPGAVLTDTGSALRAARCVHGASELPDRWVDRSMSGGQ